MLSFFSCILCNSVGVTKLFCFGCFSIIFLLNSSFDGFYTSMFYLFGFICFFGSDWFFCSVFHLSSAVSIEVPVSLAAGLCENFWLRVVVCLVPKFWYTKSFKPFYISNADFYIVLTHIKIICNSFLFFLFYSLEHIFLVFHKHP